MYKDKWVWGFSRLEWLLVGVSLLIFLVITVYVSVTGVG